MKQRHLFGTTRSIFRPWQSILATLLHYANASPPEMWRTEFFALKSDLLHRHGIFCGHLIQEIRKECWGPWEYVDGWGYEPTGCPGENCTRCNGTGIFDVRWVRLQRWSWCGFEFLIPDGDTRIKPDRESEVVGRIEHANYGRASDEASIWLLILCGRGKLLKKYLTMSYPCGWQVWPMLIIQQVACRASWYWRRRQCSCGKWFFTWGEGWRQCPQCRSDRQTQEVPF